MYIVIAIIAFGLLITLHELGTFCNRKSRSLCASMNFQSVWDPRC